MLPIRAEVTNAGNTTNLILRSASWSACTVGTNPRSILRNFNYARTNYTINSDTLPIFTLKNGTTFQSKTNRIIAKILFMVVASRAGNANCQFQLVKNATLGGTPSYTDINSDTSVISIDEAATSYSGGT